MLDLHGDAAIGVALVSVLPNPSASAVQEIRKSLGSKVSTATCVYREGYSEPASSYIIKNLKNASRTIINYNALPEMTCDEFVQIADSLGSDATWYHFEVRPSWG